MWDRGPPGTLDLGCPLSPPVVRCCCWLNFSSLSACNQFCEGNRSWSLSWCLVVGILQVESWAFWVPYCGGQCMSSQSNTDHIVSLRFCKCVPPGLSLSEFWMSSLLPAVPHFGWECCASSRVFADVVFVFQPALVECPAGHVNVVPCLPPRSDECLIDYIFGSALVLVPSDNFAWLLTPLYWRAWSCILLFFPDFPQ